MIRIFKFIGYALIVVLAVFVIWPEAKYDIYTPDDGYLARSAQYNLPGMPPDWQDYAFEMRDGTLLRWGETGNSAAGKATVLMVPGYTSSLDMYGDHINRLAKRGYHVVGIDLRGQGKSGRHRSEQPEKLYAKSFAVYADDVATVIRAQSWGVEKPLIVMGTSFGGHVSLRVAGDFDVPIAAMVLLAPAYEPNTAPFPLGFSKFITGVARKLGKSKHYAISQGPWRPDGTDLTAPSLCSSYPQRLYLRDTLYVRDPSQRVGGATNQYLWSLIDSGQYIQTDEFEARVTQPIHMIAASNDVIIDSQVSEDACTEGLPNCTLRIIPNTGHCLTLENDAVIKSIFDEIDMVYAKVK